MRLSGVVLTILLIAADSPRPGRSVDNTPPGVESATPAENTPVPPMTPPTPPVLPMTPPVPPGPTAAEENDALDQHLTEWTKTMNGVTNLSVQIALRRTDPVFKTDTDYRGVILCMKPSHFVIRLDNVRDRADYEAYIYNGNSLYLYSGLQRTVTEVPAPPSWPLKWLWVSYEPWGRWLLELLWLPDNIVVQLFTGMKAAEMKERFDISLFKTDERYVYLDFKPRSAKDQRKFKQLRVALYNSGKPTADLAYLPAQIYLLKPNDDTEMWTFTNWKVNLKDVDAKAFTFVPIKDEGWKHHKVAPILGTKEAEQPAKP